MVTVESIVKKELRSLIKEIEIEPSDVAQSNICKAEKFCKAQGKITFGQLKAIVDSAKRKRILKGVGEGGFKAVLRLLPWFLPQVAILGFLGSSMRSLNKIFRPTITETDNYKKWWGKAIMKSFDLAEGELNIEDPLSRIFFISDGLMTMMNDRYKLKFANYISDLASSKSDNEEVPEFFVENELRSWINKKFLIDPPIPPKILTSDENLPFDQEIKEGYKFRTFKSNTKSNELKWHFDLQDRKVTILESDGWEFQMDNELPITLNEGDELFIPKGVYHRVKKGNGDLRIKILEM